MCNRILDDVCEFETFHDCKEFDDNDHDNDNVDSFHDSHQCSQNFFLSTMPSFKRGVSGHMGPNIQCAQEWEVDDLLDDMTTHHLLGKSERFSTLSCAVQTVEKLQCLEDLQPRLACKP